MITPPELIARMADVCRKAAAIDLTANVFVEARAIVADPDFPKEVDPLLIEAREIAAAVWRRRDAIGVAGATLNGYRDGCSDVETALAALRRRS